MEAFAASGEYLVSIGLMAHVPYDAVVGGVHDVVQGHGQFDGAEARGEVAGIVGQFVDDGLPQFVAHLGQCLFGQCAQVVRTVYVG